MYETTSAFLERLRYTQQKNGAWKAEFHGPFDIVAVADTLERCRSQAQQSLDEEVAKAPNTVFHSANDTISYEIAYAVSTNTKEPIDFMESIVFLRDDGAAWLAMCDTGEDFGGVGTGHGGYHDVRLDNMYAWGLGHRPQSCQVALPLNFHLLIPLPLRGPAQRSSITSKSEMWGAYYGALKVGVSVVMSLQL